MDYLGCAMNDKELADRCVALGVGLQKDLNGYYCYPPNSDTPIHYQRLVRDWRVAGSLMEKMDGELLIWRINYEDEDLEGGELISVLTGYAWVVEPVRSKDSRQDESLPRAIIEACCEALND